MMTNIHKECLEGYLHKQEIQWIAANVPGGDFIDWLVPHCGAVDDLAEYLREIGFRVKRIVDDTDCGGNRIQYVVTTSGVIVYADGSGYVARHVRI